MPNIAQLKRIIDKTPAEQNILLIGDHGIGKSEILTSIFKGKMPVVTLFLGQNSDPGDIIGLPYHEIVDVNGVKKTVTRFAPPEWWPIDGKPIVLFIDEANRGRPEIMNCMMDLLLNKKLRDLVLPKGSRIVGAVNPMKDGFYQVEDLDPAFLDRWNVYDFQPDTSEWIEYAFESGVHEMVVSFIQTYPNMLYPPSKDKHKAGEVSTSARSWVRLSNIILNDESVLSDFNLLNDIATGIIGLGASVSFRKFVAEKKNLLSPDVIIQDWNKTIAARVDKLSVPDATNLCDQLILYLRGRENEMDNKEVVKKWATNLGYFVDMLSHEVQMHFFAGIGTELHANRRSWPKIIMAADTDRKITQKFAELQLAKNGVSSKNKNSR